PTHLPATEEPQQKNHNEEPQQSYTQRLTPSTDLSASWAQYRTRLPGRPLQVDPLYSLSLRHQFSVVPPFMMLDRRGTIAGKVFQDATGDGTYRHAGNCRSGSHSRRYPKNSLLLRWRLPVPARFPRQTSRAGGAAFQHAVLLH